MAWQWAFAYRNFIFFVQNAIKKSTLDDGWDRPKEYKGLTTLKMFPLLQGLINSDSANGVTKVEQGRLAPRASNGMLNFLLENS